MQDRFKDQVELFTYVRETRGGKCEVTGKFIPEPLSYCFAHVLPKGLYPEHKHNPNNIIMVSTMELHEQHKKIKDGRVWTYTS